MSSARWDLRGGPPARAVPTAIDSGTGSLTLAPWPMIQSVLPSLHSPVHVRVTRVCG